MRAPRLACLLLSVLPAALPACRCDRVPPGGTALVHEGGMIRDNVRALAASGEHVYYAEGEHGSGWRLRRVPRAGGATSQIAEVHHAIRSIVPSGDAVFFATDGAVYRASGGGPATRLLESDDVCGSTGGCGLAADATHLYVTTKTGVARIPILGGPRQDIVSGFAGPGGISVALALDATHVYWLHALEDGLHRAPKAGGAVETVVPSLEAVNRDPTLVVSEGFVYYLSGQTLRRAPVAGGAPSVIARTGSHAGTYHGGFRLLGDTVYFTRSRAYIGAGRKRSPGVPARTEGEGGVMKVPVTGGEPVWVARGVDQVYALDVDSSAVYFATDKGQVIRHPL